MPARACASRRATAKIAFDFLKQDAARAEAHSAAGQGSADSGFASLNLQF
jgi:hypothetical protein